MSFFFLSKSSVSYTGNISSFKNYAVFYPSEIQLKFFKEDIKHERKWFLIQFWFKKIPCINK